MHMANQVEKSVGRIFLRCGCIDWGLFPVISDSSPSPPLHKQDGARCRGGSPPVTTLWFVINRIIVLHPRHRTMAALL